MNRRNNRLNRKNNRLNFWNSTKIVFYLAFFDSFTCDSSLTLFIPSKLKHLNTKFTPLLFKAYNVGFNSVKVQEGGGVNWPFKSFAHNQILSQYTENKSIYLAMNRFILTLFMFKKSLYQPSNSWGYAD